MWENVVLWAFYFCKHIECRDKCHEKMELLVVFCLLHTVRIIRGTCGALKNYQDM